MTSRRSARRNGHVQDVACADGAVGGAAGKKREGGRRALSRHGGVPPEAGGGGVWIVDIHLSAGEP